MTETEQAIAIANEVLDKVGEDPDRPMAILARQLLRRLESPLRVHEEQRERMLSALVSRLKRAQATPGATYPLDTVERQLLIEAIER